MANDYILTRDCVLPSKGLIYDTPIDPNVTLRSMTTNEEMKRLQSSERPFKVLCNIIDDCIISKHNFSSYNLCLGDYQYLLYQLRIVTYGPQYDMQVRCPYCGTSHDEKLNLEDLPLKELAENFSFTNEIELPVSKKIIKLKYQTPRIMDDIKERAKDIKIKNPGLQGDPTFLVSIEKLVDTIDGEKIHPVKVTEFIKTLPMQDTNYLVAYSDKINSLIGYDVDLTVNCDFCGLDYRTGLRTTAEFFRPKINI